MKLTGKTCLILGGTGMVGSEIILQIISMNPKSIILTSLGTPEDKINFNILKEKIKSGYSKIQQITSNHFDFCDKKIEDKQTSLYKLIVHNKPDIIIDCVNSAGYLAYNNKDSAKLFENLIRYNLILYQAMRSSQKKRIFKNGCEFYLKIGTTGTGGMGLNIPYTHGETRSSNALLMKASLAWANTGLLFLLSRTPDAPIIKEVKPGSVIGWGEIGFGPIQRRGENIPLIDSTKQLNVEEVKSSNLPFVKLNKNLSSVYISTGENGYFSLQEFTAITEPDQMEMILAEEVAKYAISELKGKSTGFDVISSLNVSVMRSSYKAGIHRSQALKRMRDLEIFNKVSSIAFELLGPPRLSKLLFEAYLIKKVFGFKEFSRAKLEYAKSKQIEEFIYQDIKTRSQILSLGIPIILSDGKKVLGASFIKSFPKNNNYKELNYWIEQGWVDLRLNNLLRWQERLRTIGVDLKKLEEGSIVAWIFINEDHGKKDI